MRKIYFLLISFMFLTGCAQNLALLGPAVSIATTGGVQQAMVGGTINYGIKNETGKNVGEHLIKLVDENIEDKVCNNNPSNSLQEIFFDSSQGENCKNIQ